MRLSEIIAGRLILLTIVFMFVLGFIMPAPVAVTKSKAELEKSPILKSVAGMAPKNPLSLEGL